MEGKKVKVPDEPSSEVCDLCGRPMVIKVCLLYTSRCV